MLDEILVDSRVVYDVYLTEIFVQSFGAGVFRLIQVQSVRSVETVHASEIEVVETFFDG